jgi:hypothetical protein
MDDKLPTQNPLFDTLHICALDEAEQYRAGYTQEGYSNKLETVSYTCKA